MFKNKRTKQAFREAVADTLVAFCINVPLNFIVVAFAYSRNFSAIETSILLTTLFTSLALIRKTYIRLHFDKRYTKGSSVHGKD